MKFSTAVSMALAPVALAKLVQNHYPLRRSVESQPHEHLENKRAKLLSQGFRGFGVSQGVTLAEVVVIWVNPGLNAATTIVNAPTVVTKTVIAGAAATETSVAGKLSSLPGVAATATVASQATQVSGVAGASGSVVASTGKNHTVIVGGPANKLTFEPAELQAAVGDTVIFSFLSNNHSATQSAFATPCQPLAQGFDSGFQANVNNTVDPPPQIAMQVMVATPVWFFCAQSGHCGKGMTFSINPTAAKTQAMFQGMAIQQAGAGTGSVITGNGSGAAAAAPAAGSAGASASASVAADSSTAASSSVVAGADAAATSLTATLSALSDSTATAVAGGAVATGSVSSSGVTTGTGSLNADGSCSCAVVCQPGAFPAVAQGNGAFGGFPGAIPATMVGVTA